MIDILIFSLKKNNFFLVFFIVLEMFIFFPVKKVYAQIIQLSPSTGTYQAGQEFNIDININTEGKEIISSDIKLMFDPAKTEVIRVLREGELFFTDVVDYIAKDKVLIGGFFREVYQKKSGNGKVATLVLKGKTQGNISLTLACTPGSFDDSNIFETPENDIIKCDNLTNGNYTILEGNSTISSISTSTLTPTVSLSPTANPSFILSPTDISTRTFTLTPPPPQSGVSLPTVLFSFFGGLLLIISSVFLF